MKILSNIARYLYKEAIFIPNIPFFIPFVIFLLYKIFKHNTIRELALRGDEPFPQELIDYMDKVYPEWLRKSIAIAFWTYIIIEAIKSYV